MSEENQTGNQDVQESELDSLKRVATQMGISFHPNIKDEAKLREKIDAVRNAGGDNTPEQENDPELTPEPNTAPAEPEAGPPAAEETKTQRRQRLLREATRLVRVRITCMNPMKSEWQGEIFTVGNRSIGNIKKFVPFETEWHVPQAILNMIEERKYQMFYTVRDKRTGQTGRKGKMVKEFAIERLPDLTEEELHDLKQRQAMANGTSAE